MVEVWPSANYVADIFSWSKGSIRKAVKEKYIAAYGYFWRDKTDDDVKNGFLINIEAVRSEYFKRLSTIRNYKKIYKLDPNTKQIIKIYNTLTEAELDNGIPRTMLSRKTNAQKEPVLYKKFLWMREGLYNENKNKRE